VGKVIWVVIPGNPQNLCNQGQYTQMKEAIPVLHNPRGEDSMRSVLSDFPTMPARSARHLVRLLVIPALSLALHSAPAVAANNGCSDATLSGSYGFTIQGFSPNLDGTTSPIKGVAITHFDGAGKLTQQDFVITAGLPQPSNGTAQAGFKFSTGETGKYTLNANCTGTAEIDLNAPVPFGSAGVIKLMIVVTNGGRAIHTVVSELTPPGATEPSLVTTSSDAWKIEPDVDPH
jgi:hypothetical protein